LTGKLKVQIPNMKAVMFSLPKSFGLDGEKITKKCSMRRRAMDKMMREREEEGGIKMRG
jgi:hypothetical protein